MQVNNVHQSPNFGMALKIKPSAVDALKNLSRGEIEQLQKAGEALKDTKYWHMVIGENGDRTIVSPWANKYAGGSFEVTQPTDEFLKFKATWAGSPSGDLKPGDRYSGCIKFANRKAAEKAYADISQSSSYAGYGVDRDVKMIKYLDAREIEKTAEENAKRAEAKAISNMVDDLFAKYPAQ